ncbi:hypothetical protein ANO11243_088390 [Dothideomycetidae sp. 11243]|nr:hypothetical protein ANO11243_088390 [fungal sp. No.11243]
MRSGDEESKTSCRLSCYQSLISLGDLARWRATEKLDKEPTWGAAIGYYDLAIALRPLSGIAFNQRSIIAQADRDHLRATYYLYRSIVVAEPFERGLANLELHMSSLRKKWGTPEFSVRSNASGPEGANKALVAWFLRLHSMSYSGEIYKGHDELESEVVNRLESHALLAETPAILMKVVLINSAAERTSLLRLRDAAEEDHAPILQAFYSFQRLNLATFKSLIQVWTKMMEFATPGTNPNNIARMMNTVLPALRTYSLWLLANYRFVLPESVDDSLQLQAKEFWNDYATMLSSISFTYPVQNLPHLSYLLDEDVDAAGFQPFESEETSFIWINNDGSMKPKHSDSSVQREDLAVEQMARLKDLQIIGLLLATQEESPLVFKDGRFSCGGAMLTSIRKTHEEDKKLTDAPFEPPIDIPSDFRFPTYGQGIGQVSFEAAETLHARQPTTAATPAVTPEAKNDQDASKLFDPQEELAINMVDDLVGPDMSPHPFRLSATVFGTRIEDIPATRTEVSPSSFVPTPPTARSLPKVERLSATSLFGKGQEQHFTSGLHSPLLFGSGGVWSTGTGRKSVVNETPPNGQGG